MKNYCLVLAFRNLHDLPLNWMDFTHIDVYGKLKNKNEVLPKNVTYFPKKFLITNYKKHSEPYSYCFIRHPDPYEENQLQWIKAIAGLGECLKGTLECQFLFLGEMLWFHDTLTKLIGKNSVKFIDAKKLNEDEYKMEHHCAIWDINTKGVQKNMIIQYEKKKAELIRRDFSEKSPLLYNLDSLNDEIQAIKEIEKENLIF